MIYFASDHHFGHHNIVSFCARPFASTAEMNEGLIERHNARVTDDDEVYFLGDVSFGNPKLVIPRLRGRKHLIIGNHDWDRKNQLHACPFQWIKDVHLLKFDGVEVWLSHYPHLSWPGSRTSADRAGSWHLHGHTHGTLGKRGTGLRRVDVGVDCWDYAPVAWDEIAALDMPPSA